MGAEEETAGKIGWHTRYRSEWASRFRAKTKIFSPSSRLFLKGGGEEQTLVFLFFCPFLRLNQLASVGRSMTKNAVRLGKSAEDFFPHSNSFHGHCRGREKV